MLSISSGSFGLPQGCLIFPCLRLAFAKIVLVKMLTVALITSFE